jgi:ABC-type branched-subunit amino acid transport system ATPase component
VAEPALEVRGLRRRFGGVTAVEQLDLSLAPAQSLGLIGPNGAGKSTVIELVCGALRPTAGTVRLGGQDVSRLPASARARLGIGRTHQIPRPFGRMTVLDNVVLAGRHARGPREPLAQTRARCRTGAGTHRAARRRRRAGR